MLASDGVRARRVGLAPTAEGFETQIARRTAAETRAGLETERTQVGSSLLRRMNAVVASNFSREHRYRVGIFFDLVGLAALRDAGGFL